MTEIRKIAENYISRYRAIVEKERKSEDQSKNVDIDDLLHELNDDNPGVIMIELMKIIIEERLYGIPQS